MSPTEFDEHPTDPRQARVQQREVPDEPEISFRPLFRVLWGYRRHMMAVISGVLIAVAFWALSKYLKQPSERHSSVEIRLLFDGAERGQYPNGLSFSRAEIIAPPILNDVYEANDLKRYCTFDQFKNGVFILESSRELEFLNAEYQSKLSDTRLSPVDRARLEAEFRQKREALQVPQYTLMFMNPNLTTEIPEVLMSKVLNDILATWAEEAATVKGVLSYQVRVLTPSMMRQDNLEAEDYLVRLDMLRAQVNRLLENVDEVMALPGASVMRIGPDRISLPDIRANLEELVRFKLQPLIGLLRGTGISRDPVQVTRYLQSRLVLVRQEKLEADGNLATLQNALQVYSAGRAGVSAGDGGAGAAAQAGASTVMPQLGESFLDRLVEMAGATGDIQYRQELTNQVIEAGKDRVALEKEEAYYEEMLAATGRSSNVATDRTQIELRFKEIYARIVEALRQTNDLYAAVSARNLNPRTTLYAVTSPYASTTTRALSLRRVGIYVGFALMVTLVLTPLIFLLYHYVRTEVMSYGEKANTRAKPHVDNVVGV